MALQVPAEILAKVISDYSIRDEEDEKERRFFPVPYTHVCRQWRDIAISTPSLWTKLELFPVPDSAKDDPEAKDSFFQVHASRCQAYIDRSQDCLLSIHVYGSYELTPSIDTLLSCFNRWEYAHIRVVFTTLKRIIDETTMGAGFPHLLHLSLTRSFHESDFANGFSSLGAMLNAVDIFQRAPKLHTVSLMNFEAGDSMKLSEAWAQVKTLQASASMMRVAEFLEHTPHLDRLVLSDLVLPITRSPEHYFNDTGEEYVFADLPQLRDICLYPRLQSGHVYIFQSMSCPKLDALEIKHIRMRYKDDDEDWLTLTQWLTQPRTPFTLTCLTLQQIYWSPHDWKRPYKPVMDGPEEGRSGFELLDKLVDVLEAAPMLRQLFIAIIMEWNENLEIQHPISIDYLLKALTLGTPHPRQNLCRGLEELSILAMVAYTPDPLITMLSSRRPTLIQLPDVDLVSSSDLIDIERSEATQSLQIFRLLVQPYPEPDPLETFSAAERQRLDELTSGLKDVDIGRLC